jgi:hypothetical protein
MLGLPLDVFYRVQQVTLDLPNSRACETEGCYHKELTNVSADYVGLLYMAKVELLLYIANGRHVITRKRDRKFGNG